MQRNPFAGLGVAEPIIEALRRRSIHSPFSIQTLVLPDAPRGKRRAGQVADRLG